MPNKQIHPYMPMTGVRDDFLAIMNEFLELKTVRFAEFSNLWRSKKMAFLCAGRASTREAREFIEGGFLIALDFFLPPYQFQVRVGGLYLLYALFETQPIIPKAKIRLTQDHWKETMRFQQEAAQQNHLDVVYVFNRMLQSHAYTFCFTPMDMDERSIAQDSANTVMNLADSMKDDRRDIDTLFNYEAMEQLSYLLDHYQQMKVNLAGPEATQPDKSLDVVQGTMVEDLVTVLQSFKATAGNIDQHGRSDGPPSNQKDDTETVETTGSRRQALKARAFSQMSKTKGRSTFVMSVDDPQHESNVDTNADDVKKELPATKPNLRSQKGGISIGKCEKVQTSNEDIVFPHGGSTESISEFDDEVIQVEVYTKSNVHERSLVDGEDPDSQSMPFLTEMFANRSVKSEEWTPKSPKTRTEKRISSRVTAAISKPGTSGVKAQSRKSISLNLDSDMEESSSSPDKSVKKKGKKSLSLTNVEFDYEEVSSPSLTSPEKGKKLKLDVKGKGKKSVVKNKGGKSDVKGKGKKLDVVGKGKKSGVKSNGKTSVVKGNPRKRDHVSDTSENESFDCEEISSPSLSSPEKGKKMNSRKNKLDVTGKGKKSFVKGKGGKSDVKGRDGKSDVKGKDGKSDVKEGKGKKSDVKSNGKTSVVKINLRKRGHISVSDTSESESFDCEEISSPSLSSPKKRKKMNSCKNTLGKGKNSVEKADDKKSDVKVKDGKLDAKDTSTKSDLKVKGKKIDIKGKSKKSDLKSNDKTSVLKSNPRKRGNVSDTSDSEDCANEPSITNSTSAKSKIIRSKAQSYKTSCEQDLSAGSASTDISVIESDFESPPKHRKMKRKKRASDELHLDDDEESDSWISIVKSPTRKTAIRKPFLFLSKEERRALNCHGNKKGKSQHSSSSSSTSKSKQKKTLQANEELNVQSKKTKNQLKSSDITKKNSPAAISMFSGKSSIAKIKQPLPSGVSQKNSPKSFIAKIKQPLPSGVSQKNSPKSPISKIKQPESSGVNQKISPKSLIAKIRQPESLGINEKNLHALSRIASEKSPTGKIIQLPMMKVSKRCPRKDKMQLKGESITEVIVYKESNKPTVFKEDFRPLPPKTKMASPSQPSDMSKKPGKVVYMVKGGSLEGQKLLKSINNQNSNSKYKIKTVNGTDKDSIQSMINGKGDPPK